MLKKFGNNSLTLWKSKNPHSVEYLRYLNGVLIKNEIVTQNNQSLIIEAFRSIAEVLIWGDQNDNSVFDFFLERQMFTFFISIMKQNCSDYVNVQLLQTLNILFENIKHETSLYYLFSNNHVNSIVLYKFNFSNEEVIGYYISFLKTLSFQLNSNTIHFFFNEVNEEFPLLTETIKYFDHHESMIRIAVRTITLNVFKILDTNVSKFVLKECESYFNNFAQQMTKQIIDMDVFARSAQNEESNRKRLLSMIDVHLDYMHYINDILIIEKNDLNNLLIKKLFYIVFGPLYMSSLAVLRRSSTVLLSKVSALFLLSNFINIVNNQSALEIVLTCLLFGDENDVCSEWIRDSEKNLSFQNCNLIAHPQERIFFNSLLKTLCEFNNDHVCFYGIVLIDCIMQNKSIQSDMLLAAQIPNENNNTQICDPCMSQNFIQIIKKCSAQETSIRPITVKLCCIVLKNLLTALNFDNNKIVYSNVFNAVSTSINALILNLKKFVFSEELFLEMFENEYYFLENLTLKISTILEDAGLYLPPSNTPLSKTPLFQRLSCGNHERICHLLQFYFILKKFKLDLDGEEETELPLSRKIKTIAEVNDCINLNNSDLLSCTVVINKTETYSRYLVTDQFQLILVDPDSRKLGWAIVRFVGLLQNTQVTNDSTDSRVLHVLVEDFKTVFDENSSKKPLLKAKFIFDDHIRCMAAKRRLDKGRKNSRQFKLKLICDLFGIKPGLCNLPNSRKRNDFHRLSTSHQCFFDSKTDFKNDLCTFKHVKRPGIAQKLCINENSEVLNEKFKKIDLQNKDIPDDPIIQTDYSLN